MVVAPTVGPTLGGWLTDNLSWHWIFLINVPIGVVSLVLVNWLVTEPEVLEARASRALARGLQVDWIGFMLVALFLGCLEIVLDKGQEDDWFASNFILFFATVSFVSFVAVHPLGADAQRSRSSTQALRPPRLRLVLADDAARRRDPVRTTQLMPQLLQGDLSVFGDAVGPGADAGRTRHADADAGGRRARRLTSAEISHRVRAWLLVGARHVLHDVAVRQADFSFYAWARVLQTIGLPFVFIPITSASYTGLPPEKTGEASSLINVARNLGGSIGISVATTISRAAPRCIRTISSIIWCRRSSAYQNEMAHATHSLTTLGVPASNASMAAVAYVNQMVQQQAALLAYIDVFRYLAVVALIMAPVALFLLPSQTPRAVGH